MELPIIPPQASSVAGQIDHIYYTMVALSIFFTGLVFALMVGLVVRYRRGSKVDRSNPSFGNLYMELGWSIIPGIIGVLVFIWSVKPYADVYNPPADATEIFVIGKRWMWHLQHSNGIRENNQLHIPLNRAIKLTMISQDVIHGFYVPAFRVKRDCLPGYYNTVWFKPTEVGKFPFYCTEYCGTNHSEMGGYVYVMTPSDYLHWKQSGGNDVVVAKETAVDRGQNLFYKYGCSNCHGEKGNLQGPSLVGLYNTQVALKNGTTVPADNNFIRSSIVNPESVRIKGYPDLMQAYSVGSGSGQLTEEEILDLIAYIKSLSNNPVPQNSTAKYTRKKSSKTKTAQKNTTNFSKQRVALR